MRPSDARYWRALDICYQCASCTLYWCASDASPWRPRNAPLKHTPWMCAVDTLDALIMRASDSLLMHLGSVPSTPLGCALSTLVTCHTVNSLKHICCRWPQMRCAVDGLKCTTLSMALNTCYLCHCRPHVHPLNVLFVILTPQWCGSCVAIVTCI